MVEHRAILRMVKKSTVVSSLPPEPHVAHLTNLTFDVSIWETFVALLNGGTLVCIDYSSSFNGNALLTIFQREKIQVAFFPPALLKLYLSSTPALFQHLRAVYVGGERFNSSDAIKARALVQGSVYNLYGPSENALGSTIYKLTDQEPLTNGVPIGRSVSNSAAFVMDSLQCLVPLAVIGELVVTGDGLARGYTDPALDQDRFIHITVDGVLTKAYRTGDRVRYRPSNAQLEFFGRMDHQVKIRGHRIELAEIEGALLRRSLVRDAVALAREVDGQEMELVSFITLDNGGQEAEASLRTALKLVLPSYMIPRRICILEKMPLNANGKADRQALGKVVIPPASGRTTRVMISPRNDMERAVCEEFTHALGLEVGAMDNFFEIGGHSLMATRLASRISQRLHLHCTVGDIFLFPVVADLAQKVSRSLGTAPYAPIPRVQIDGPVEQSFAQTRLWTLHQLFPTTTTFLLRQATRLRGPLRIDALANALLALEERHDALRTTFEQRDKFNVQIVHPFHKTRLQVVDIVGEDPEELMEFLRQEHETPFDLEVEPGWRSKVFCIGKEDHILSIVMHHIIYDGWSVDIIQRELATFYAAAVIGQDPLAQVRSLSIQYRDFAVWQKQEAQVAEQQRQLEYWKKQLAGSHAAELLHDKPRPTVRSGTVEVLPMDIIDDLYHDLKQFCKLHQATPYTVLLSAFRVTHYRLSGMDDAIIGMLVANRNRQELEDVVGFFTNLLGIRIPIKDVAFEDLVQQVQQATSAASENQDVPFESVMAELRPEARGVADNPLVRIEFIVNSQHNMGRLQLDGVETELMELPSVRGKRTSPFDVEFHFFEEDGMIAGTLAYSDELFVESSVRHMINLFFEVLQHGLREPTISVTQMGPTS
ncbi:hypothetical protein J1614_008183 [Plenodomus biglobosus]|nr:hypothetical protein J1614_008183 [Plenodomus biglobosus]